MRGDVYIPCAHINNCVRVECGAVFVYFAESIETVRVFAAVYESAADRMRRYSVAFLFARGKHGREHNVIGLTERVRKLRFERGGSRVRVRLKDDRDGTVQFMRGVERRGYLGRVVRVIGVYGFAERRAQTLKPSRQSRKV